MADYKKLLFVLKTVKKLLENSEASAYAGNTTEELIGIIDSNINQIETKEELNKKELEFLFGPTASLQETAIDNGWGEEFIDLSTQFDRVIK